MSNERYLSERGGESAGTSRLRVGSGKRETHTAILVVAVVLVSAIVLGFILAKARETTAMGIIDSKMFSKLASKGVVVAMFWSETCPHCLEIIDEWRLLEKSPPSGISVIDVLYKPGINDDLFAEYSVTVTPTFILMKDGKVIAKRTESFKGESLASAVLEWVEQSLELSGAESPKSAIPGETLVDRLGKLAYLGLGALIALSPCTTPILVLYAGVGTVTRICRREIVLCGAASFAGIAAIGAIVVFAASIVAKAMPGFLVAMAAAAILFGFLSMTSSLPAYLPSWTQRYGVRLLCFGAGALAVQCSLPLIGGALALAGASESILSGLTNVSLIALGLSAMLVLVLALASRASKLLYKLTAGRKLIGVVGGLLLVVAGSYLLMTGW